MCSSTRDGDQVAGDVVARHIHYNRGKVYIRHILTHAEYDRGAWKE